MSAIIALLLNLLLQVYGTPVKDYNLEINSPPRSNDNLSRGCHQILTEISGNVTSPGFPAPLPSHALHCHWSIDNPRGDYIKLDFQLIDLPPPHLHNCDRGYLSYGTVDSSGRPVLHNKVCGTLRLDSYVTSTHHAWITLVLVGPDTRQHKGVWIEYSGAPTTVRENHVTLLIFCGIIIPLACGIPSVIFLHDHCDVHVDSRKQKIMEAEQQGHWLFADGGNGIDPKRERIYNFDSSIMETMANVTKTDAVRKYLENLETLQKEYQYDTKFPMSYSCQSFKIAVNPASPDHPEFEPDLNQYYMSQSMRNLNCKSQLGVNETSPTPSELSASSNALSLKRKICNFASTIPTGDESFPLAGNLSLFKRSANESDRVFMSFKNTPSESSPCLLSPNRDGICPVHLKENADCLETIISDTECEQEEAGLAGGKQSRKKRVTVKAARRNSLHGDYRNSSQKRIWRKPSDLAEISIAVASPKPWNSLFSITSIDDFFSNVKKGDAKENKKKTLKDIIYSVGEYKRPRHSEYLRPGDASI